MSHSPIHFFKVILERTLKDGELKVPKSFVERHWQGISTPDVKLRLPNGTEWKVYWLKRDGGVYFRNGWKEFAEHLSLEVSQFVLFGYEGNSSFNVIVLGKTALEIDYPSKDNTSTHEEIEEEEECDRDYCFKEGKKQKPASASSVTPKKMKTSPKEEHASVSNAKNRNCTESTDKELNERIEALVKKVKNHYRDYQSPTFTCAIRKSYIERDLLIIPNEFAGLHLNKMEGEKATLFVDQDRTWDVELSVFSGAQLSFGNGWRKFLIANNLNLGDVCVFVLDNKSNRISFKVHIYPLRKYSTTLLFQEGCAQRPSSSLKAPKTHRVGRKSASEVGFYVHIRCSLTSTSVPFNYMKKFVSESDNGKYANLRVGDEKWPVKFLYYEHNSCSRFSHGWGQFVKGCELKNGDVCHFKMVDVEELEFQVTKT